MFPSNQHSIDSVTFPVRFHADVCKQSQFRILKMRGFILKMSGLKFASQKYFAADQVGFVPVHAFQREEKTTISSLGLKYLCNDNLFSQFSHFLSEKALSDYIACLSFPPSIYPMGHFLSVLTDGQKSQILILY